MDKHQILALLTSVQKGEMSPEQAVHKLKISPFEDLGYAKIDHHRGIRQGVPEVIFGQGKTSEQIQGIVQAMLDRGEENILITRISSEVAEEIMKITEMEYHPLCKVGIVGRKSKMTTSGFVLVATGGTSDIPVAEEAALTAEVLGNKVERLYDVGVAGLHRLLTHTELLMQANVVIAVAGMEGALASVIGGFVDCPVIAVPTSVGYGANFGGIAALLSMLNSCASGVGVVNIDNGFGAGYLASMINHR
ncbi:nickel pincer cofactor biosynthesis protein LarB [Clostridiaceae bacterium 35-E11]